MLAHCRVSRRPVNGDLVLYCRRDISCPTCLPVLSVCPLAKNRHGGVVLHCRDGPRQHRPPAQKCRASAIYLDELERGACLAASAFLDRREKMVQSSGQGNALHAVGDDRHRGGRLCSLPDYAEGRRGGLATRRHGYGDVHRRNAQHGGHQVRPGGTELHLYSLPYLRYGCFTCLYLAHVLGSPAFLPPLPEAL